MNKTKIIATIGPASKEKEILKQMFINGLDVIRLNLSHADYEFCQEVIAKVHELNEELGTSVAIMLDTKGPNIRTGKFTNGKAFLKKDDKIRIYMKDVIGDNTKFSVNYSELVNDVNFGTILKLSDGEIELEVLDKSADSILCLVLREGLVFDNKSINIPNLKLSRPFLSRQDKEDIKFASKMQADFLALSYVCNSENVLEVNDLLISLGNDHIGVIAKIENQEAVEDIDNIIKVSEGVMVARGDLGVEVSLEKIPSIQKQIISKCHLYGVVSIVATDLLASMENSLKPTRSEVSDIANAVLDGTDAVMLCGETTVGKYPIQTIKMLEKIIQTNECYVNYYSLMQEAIKTEKKDITGVLSYSVIGCANNLNCKAIFTPTVTGYTAKKMSRFRPSCPVVAISPNKETVRMLNLYYGIFPILVDDLRTMDNVLEKSRELAIKRLKLNYGDYIIVTGGHPFKAVKHTNFMKIEEI